MLLVLTWGDGPTNWHCYPHSQSTCMANKAPGNPASSLNSMHMFWIQNWSPTLCSIIITGLHGDVSTSTLSLPQVMNFMYNMLHRSRSPRLLRLCAGRMAGWSFRQLFRPHAVHAMYTEGLTEWRLVAMETMVLGSWLCGEWGEGWMVAGVIEAVMSLLMVHRVRIEKATTQQAMISRVCANI